VASEPTQSGTGAAFRTVADLADLLEAHGIRVSECKPVTWPETMTDGTVTVSLTVGVPTEGSLAVPEDAGALVARTGQSPDAVRECSVDALPTVATSAPIGATTLPDQEDSQPSETSTETEDSDDRPFTEVLRERLVDTAPIEATSADLADALDLDASSRKLGQTLARLREDASELAIDRERAHRGAPSTWTVTRVDQSETPTPPEYPDDLEPAVEPADESKRDASAEDSATTPTATDGGATVDQSTGSGLASPSASQPRCQNCGTQVTQDYVRVFAPDGIENPRMCPSCPDLVRDGSDVRRARSSKGKAKRVEADSFDLPEKGGESDGE
jgi:hypothetical protein